MTPQRDSRRNSTGGSGSFNKAMGVFRQFDSNRDGTIDRLELRFLLANLDSKWTDRRADAVFEAIDTNKDGKIQFEELLRWTFSGRGEAAKAEEQPLFRQTTELDHEIRGLVRVEVRKEAGDTVYGPEELLGSISVSQLRRKIRSSAGVSVGCLLCGETILRDSLQVGVYAEGPALELRIVEDALSLLTRACSKELKDLGVMGKFEGQTCIRLGTCQPAESSERMLPSGEDLRELLLLADGRLMAKELKQRWRRCSGSGVPERSWHYTIAEGSFGLLDAGTCHAEVSWRGWAEASGEDKTGQSAEEVLGEWEGRMLDEDDAPGPHHLMPSKGNQINVLVVARDWARPERQSSGFLCGSLGGYSGDGIPIPGLDEGVLDGLEMDARNLSYWRHGGVRGRRPSAARSV